MCTVLGGRKQRGNQINCWCLGSATAGQLQGLWLGVAGQRLGKGCPPYLWQLTRDAGPWALAALRFPLSSRGQPRLASTRLPPQGAGKLQMKSCELLPLVAFYPAKCFVALFMTSSVMREPGIKRLKASSYFCLQTPSRCHGFASSLAG